MKTYVCTFFSALILCCLAFYYEPYIHVNSTQVKELASINHPIRSIAPADTNYQDLTFLKEKLKGVDIVMLGEQFHGDGAAFLAKSRLIQYLHQELYFDVLLFESNIYDCFNLWENISGTSIMPPTNDFREALFYFWGSSNETKELRTYIVQHARSVRSLILGGFDLQFSGEMSDWDRAQLMKSYLTKKDVFLEKDYKQFFKTIKSYSYFKERATSISEIDKQAVFNEMDKLITRLAGIQKTNEDKVFIRYLLGIKTELHYRCMYPGNMEKQSIVRDSMMAANVIWLKEHLYKNKKIILWAANYHIAYNSKYFDSPSKQDKKMGDYLKEKYASSCYGVNFTSHFGNTYSMWYDKIFSVTEGVNYGIESMLHTMGKPVAFVDLRGIPENSSLNKKITMKFWAYFHETAHWSKITDGIFFIDRMKPATFN